MRDITLGMIEYLATEAPTLSTLWTITATDGLIVRSTDFSSDLYFDGNLYASINGHERTAIQFTSDLRDDNLSINGFINVNISRNDLLSGRYDYAAVQIWQINPFDHALGKIHLLAGHMGNITIDDNQFSVDITSRMSQFKSSQIEQSSPECRADLGDARCNVNLTLYTTTGSITSIDAFNLKLTVTLANTSINLIDGYLAFTSGVNNGGKIDIKSYVIGSGEIVLHWWPVNDPAIGDTVSVVQGCDKRFATCRDVYNNKANFRGEGNIPGSTDYYDVINAKETDYKSATS